MSYWNILRAVATFVGLLGESRKEIQLSLFHFACFVLALYFDIFKTLLQDEHGPLAEALSVECGSANSPGFSSAVRVEDETTEANYTLLSFLLTWDPNQHDTPAYFHPFFDKDYIPLKVVEYDPDNEWSANAIVTCAADAFAVKVMVVVEFAFH